MRLFTAVALGVVGVSCAEPPPAIRETKSPDAPFPAPGESDDKGRPGSGRCYSDVDCRGNGMECLSEGRGKGPGTCVRMDPALGPNGLPKGTICGTAPCN